MRFTHTIPFYSVLSTLGLFAVSPAYSSIVRSDVDYQYFRDFAENKGAFAVGASNISIQDKQGKILGRVLSGIPMPDFRVSNRQTAIATLVHPQYVNSVKHNVGYGSIQFGNDTQNPEEQAYTYRLVSRNPHPDYDYHLPRLNKLVTEISPAALSSVPLLGNGQPKANAYLDTDRFPYFVRLGSGTQQVRKADGTRTQTAPAYQYLTGGTPLKVLGFQNHGLLVGDSLTDQPLNTYAVAGDSGSPLFAFDKHENRWVLAGVLSTYAGFDSFFNKYIVTQPEFIRSTIRQYETRLDVGLTTNELIWRDNGNGDSTLQGLNERITLPIANPSLAPQNDSRHMPSEDAGKTLILSSRFDNKTLMLADNINQGAGALQFDSNFTVVGKNHTWQGAGVIVADGKRVFWQVSNPKGDRLSKLGAGTLIANGQGINQGDISIGEGTVVLAQKAASDGSKQAFNQVGITSGRGTAVLADSQQIKPENLYFGFRGGRLDLNGNNLAFTHIRHADGGAQIVNHNPDQAATLTLTGNPVLSPEHVEWVQWGNRPQGNAAVYEYINPHRNRRTDYFILKPGGNPREFFPLNMKNSTSWQFIGNNRQQAAEQVAQAENARPDLITFGGYLGENAQTGKAAPSYSKTNEAAIEKTRHIANAAVYGRPEYRYNGALNLHYRPKRTDSTLLLNGGMNLNGEVLIEGGNMIVSGRPVPHAYDHQAKREPVLENEWTDGSFKAARFTLRNHARLTAGRNTAHLDGDITAYDLSGIDLGFTQGKTPECYRSYHSGSTHCTPNAVLKAENYRALPATQVRGDITLNDRSELRLGKAHLYGSIRAGKDTAVRMEADSNWTLSQSSHTGALTLDGAQITLNPDFANNTHNNRFNTLTVNGTLDGFGTFRFLTGIVRKQNAPPLKLEGDSRGAFQIHVKNTGQEPQTTESLALVSLNPKHSHQARFTLQNGYADLGAYRYILRKNNNGYSLYNPLKEAELQIEATRAEHERNQQAYNQLQATDISRQVQHDSDATRQALQAWQNSQTELARIDSQVQYLSAQLKQTDPLTGILTRAQNLCAAQGYSADICRQVAKAADTNDLTLFETELDTYIERVEMAESELDKARQGGDAQAVETARHAYLNALNRLSRQIHSLKTGVAGIRMPNLAELISRSANTAVSEQAAYNTGRQQAGRRIDRHLTDPQQQNIWLETGTQQTDYHSGTHRPYQQTTNYAHIGIQTGITDRLSVGTILTDERTNNRFDEGVSARNRSNGAHLFVKGENGALFAAADLGYSNSRTRFTDYDGAAVRRHAWDAGINTGIKIDTGINLRPYAGIRINRSNGNRYVLDGAEINSPAQIQTTWHAGIRLDKTVELGQAKLTPAFSSDYYHTRQNSGSALSVNDRTLLQQAAHGTLHTLQIDAGYKGWNAKLHAAYGKDSNTARHKQAGIKIGYNW
ncbi:autotransporter adhesin/serine protease MspA [Neisseria meningitidis]|uniref:IgA-specific serine endopeptidase n=1 Tax=Neisseria meningitidis alpha522 TaxID=996307 RepID=I4E8I3_NEIME|nr:autotransporter adhesin/serine protease MspA [Neisseria meningitidis]CCA45652.1 IgA-specific serine endopeptidase [Neisseria meningitidis alpha522]MBG8578504.1 autotransporter domain-containing protein [Neisseria meningitidis]MBG8642942.1 autotransporter domain-containing protein [Neisseria meningitidis]MBG8714535.1 autotransporter domain-containing protein [Neisseria meningitidis]MBG8726191.1 autotransporter domain-containing protein [Neisseria meningitidis]